MTAAEVVRAAMDNGAAQKPGELEPFVELLLSRPRPQVVLEIGTMTGGTLAAWCEVAADDALLISIDLPGGRWGGENVTAEHLHRMRGLARANQTVEFLRRDSHDIDTLAFVGELLETQIDLLFIDGDHTYEGVRRDFEMYSPLVKPGGLIALHDILPHPDVPDCDVDRFWNDDVIALDGYFWEFCEPDEYHPTFGQWGGIGVLEVPA